MSNVLSEEQKQQVPALGRMGWSRRRIERDTGIYRDTAARYLREAGITVKKPGRPGKETAKPAINAAEVIPGSAPQNSKPAIPATPGKPSTPSACEPFRDTIEEALSRGRDAKAIWQDRVDDHSSTGSYQSVRRFVRKHAGPVIATPPGEEAQVDYGAGPLVRDPQSGKYRRTRLFVLTLGFSRKCVRLLCFQSSARTWAELYEKAFRRLFLPPTPHLFCNAASLHGRYPLLRYYEPLAIPGGIHSGLLFPPRSRVPHPLRRASQVPLLICPRALPSSTPESSAGACLLLPCQCPASSYPEDWPLPSC